MFSWSCYLVFCLNNNDIYITVLSPSELWLFYNRKSKAQKRQEDLSESIIGESVKEHQVFSLWPIVLLTPSHHLFKLIIANTTDLQPNSHRHFCKTPFYREENTKCWILQHSTYPVQSHYRCIDTQHKFRDRSFSMPHCSKLQKSRDLSKDRN